MKIHVAVIEDEYYTRQAIRQYIIKLGPPYEYCGDADNGSSGLELLRSQRPEIALVDITMPVMNGLDMMEQARKEKLPTRMIILTGYSEFTYARTAIRLEAVDYLLKPLREEDLKHALDHASESIRRKPDALPEGFDLEYLLSSQLAEQLTRGDVDSEDTAVLVGHLGFPRRNGTYFTTLIEFYPEGDSRIRLQELLRDAREEMRARGFQGIGYHDDRNTICLVVWVPTETGAEDLCDALNSYAALARRKYHVSQKISLSTGSPDLSTLHNAYEEVQVVRHFHLFQSSRDVMLFTSENLIRMPSIPFDSEMRGQLAMILRRRDSGMLEDFINARFSVLNSGGAISLTAYLCAAEMLSVILEYASARSGHTVPEDNSGKMIPSLFEIKHIDELKKSILDKATEVIGTDDTDENTYSRLVRKVQEYIDQHFGNSALRLGDVAQAIYMSAPYLCNIYRQTTGSTIGDYIFDVRMRHAKDLMNAGEKNINVISELCGYDDAGYFSKCFRKKFGITPKQYIDSV